MSDDMKVIMLHPFGPVAAREGEEPGTMLVWLTNEWYAVAECVLCDQYSVETHRAPSGDAVCPKCAEHVANLWHYARSGRYLTWENPSRSTGDKRQRAPIRASLRSAVLLRDNYRCRYCGGFEGGLVLDHVVPWSRGGADTEDNLVAACRACNRRKGDQTPEEAQMPLLEVPR